MIPHRKHQQEDNVDSWLMSYADMITLLLGFFVIFVSVSEPKKDKLTAIAEGMSGRFGSVELATPFQGVFRSLQAVIETRQILKDVAIEKSERSVTMELSTVSFFKEGTADLDETMEQIMGELVGQLQSIEFLDYRITVEGYTNDLPVSTPYFPSNWELSTARASRVVRFFIDNGIKPSRLKAVGYGSTNPKVPNLDVNGNAIIVNRKLNERIVIRIEQTL